MSDDKEKVEEVKEFMNLLLDVKLSIAELKGDLKQVTDNKKTVENTKNTADEANNRSIENEKDIQNIIDNNRRIIYALITVGGAFVLQIVYFLLTFGIS
ncbi:hypothetical protein MUN89_15655 [Halobacillus salinarum]|uniref:Uncharacterized protein n=1 Tax=Halobacillus salinarum TaxID=2932257 RepID=A0ABY4EML5_9BACI|nr:hypothetical protein [Halobacillus salinarum]UOQ43346.1 hypothetical protein MUN89_15655 [Halobacillus salinarum]